MSISLAGAELLVRLFVPVRNVGPSFTIHDPEYGKALKKEFSGLRTTPEFSMTLSTNSDGFRGPEIKSTKRSILVLGDSFSMGYGVNDGEEYPALIRQALNSRGLENISVINAGMGDNGNGRWIKFLNSKAKAFSIDTVILQIHANDFTDNVNEQLYILSPEEELVELPVPIQRTTRKIQAIIESIPGLADLYLVGLMRQVSLSRNTLTTLTDARNSAVVFKHQEDESKLLFSLIDRSLEICRNHGWRVLVLVADMNGERLRQLETFLASRNVEYVNVPSKRDRPNLYYTIDGHWNTSGHRFAADKLLEVL